MGFFFGFDRPVKISLYMLSLYLRLPVFYIMEKGLPPPPTPDSDNEKPLSRSPVKNYLYLLLGAEKSVVSGSNRRNSASVMGVATVMWILFLVLKCQYLYYISASLMICFEVFGGWALFCSWEDMRMEVKGIYALIHFMKKYMVVYTGISLASGSWYHTLSLSWVYRAYLQFLLIVGIPLLFEHYEEKAMQEIKKRFDAFWRARRAD